VEKKSINQRSTSLNANK